MDCGAGGASSFSSPSRQNLQKPSRHSLHLDVSGSSKLDSSKVSGNDTFNFNTHSPLKRSDATMGSDPASMGSPVAKRRSLHGISSLGSDLKFNFDSPPAGRKSLEAQEDSPLFHLSGLQAPPLSTTPTSVPKRASSLRKTTLQQRHGDSRASWGRRAGERQLAQLASNEIGTPPPKSRPRLSLDQYLPPDDRGTPFAPGPLPNASVHPFQRPLPVQAPQNPHPLSRSLTQSSSNSSVTTESPTHAPPPASRIGEKPRIPAIFAKSLPIGSRPPSTDEISIATPAYKNAKPFQGAFMSTGLVSKVNRNPENGPLNGSRGKAAAIMPDTPCKKQSTSSYPFATYPPGSEGRRQPSQRPAIDSPGTLFGSSTTRRQYDITDKQERSGGIPFRASHTRKVSLISYDGDDNNVSLGGDDFPATPTKNLFPRSMGMGKGLTSTPTVPHICAASTSTSRGKQDGTQQRDSSPLGRPPSSGDSSPQTPLETMMPPENSRLSLRNVNDKLRTSRAPGSRSIPPPATPTTHGRDSQLAFGDRRVTPQNVHAPKDVDESLVTRFGRSEIIGRGEFSDVYRVAANDTFSTLALGASTPSKLSSYACSVSEQLYAVKRIKLAGRGEKARQIKYREVQALQALGGAERILNYIDSWEHGDYLYIQTEYCSEGSLDVYLEKLGNIGRMDDFRIWKIISDLAEGLQTIHEAGFIHLDLKPANVLIDYAGQLKVGDFGMATTWPAPKGIEGEGDREYMAPEILEGHFDKPADIFSLGMIIYETASNSILPDYGVVWQALRSGNAGSMAILTNTTYLNMTRDATGMPLVGDQVFGPSSLDEDMLSGAGFGGGPTFAFDVRTKGTTSHDPSNLFRSSEEKLRNHLEHPPTFMEEANDSGSIDTLVHWMLKPNPVERPTAQQIREFESVRWVNGRRKGGAIVYEGNFGPKVDDIVDTEMTDVRTPPSMRWQRQDLTQFHHLAPKVRSRKNNTTSIEDVYV